MSAVPKTYRVYTFDLDRKNVSADFLTAMDDEQAIARLHATGFGTKCELWHEDRLVAQLEAERRQA